MSSLSNGITVILCCYNHSDYVARQLEAIVSQLDEIFSVVLLDDGSTDNSYAVMSKFAEYSEKIKLISNKKNQGLVSAVNRACEFIMSKHVYFASADDQITPCFFRDFNRAIDAYPNSGFYFGDFAEVTSSGSIVRRSKFLSFNDITKLSPDEFASEIAKGFRNAPGQTVVFDTSELMRIGFFDAKLGGWLDLYPQYIIGFRKGIVYLPGIYSVARIADNSWGRVQSERVELLRIAGAAFTEKMASESDLASKIKESGILAYALDGYKTLRKVKKLTQLLALNKILLMLSREFWYALPEIIRITIIKMVRKK